MADYTHSKSATGAMFPVNAIDTEWQRCSPLITPAEVVAMHLFNVPLVSRQINPITKQLDVLDEPAIKQHIFEAVALAELETGIDIFPNQYAERRPYHQPDMRSFGTTQLDHRPVSSVEEYAVVSSDGINVWNVPTEWIDPGYLQYGQITIMPFAVAAQSGISIPITQPVAAGLLPSLFQFSWIPALFTIRYSTGFPKGQLPVILNHLIGVITACEILSQIATTFAYTTSVSIGIDGISESVSQPGPQIFVQRLEELMAKRKWVVARLRRQFGLGFQINNA